MSSTLSSVRSSPIPDLAYDSYKSLSLRDQTLLRRQLGGSNHHIISGSQNVSTGGGVNNIHEYSDSPAGLLPQQQVLLQEPQLIQRHPHGISGNPSNNNQNNKPEKVFDMNNPGNVRMVQRRPSNFVVHGGKAYAIDGYAGETLAFWILLAILIVLVLGNAILTFIIYGVIRVRVGTESIEFLPKSLKFFGDTDLDEIYKRDGIIQGFHNKPVEISGEDGGEVHLWTHEGSQPSLSVERGAINITQVEEFRVVDKKGREVFSTNTPTLGLPRGVQKLDVRVAKVNRITSPINASLQLVSTTYTHLRGSEGTHMEGRQIVFKADQDIFLQTVNGNLIISGRNGTYLNVHDLPLVRESGVTRKSYTYTTHGKKEPQFQLCICMPEGKLFRVEIPVDNASRKGRNKIGCHTPRNSC